MPANPWEVDAALAEGVRIDYLAAPVRVVVEGGRVVGMECLRMELGAPDSSGRRRPVPVAGSEFILEVEMVIPAISQAPDLGYLGEGHGFKLTKWNTLAVDGVSLATSVAGVFAGGDVVNGPATVIEAIAQGREAAESIHRYLRGEDLVAGRTKDWVKATEVWRQEVQRAHREHMGEVGVTDRVGDFREVEAGYTEEQAKAEASRCLDCGVCSECMECVKVCEAKAFVHEKGEAEIIETEVGAIILATGYDLLPKSRFKEIESDPDILDGLQFERILCPSGPTDGVVIRPSDRTEPKEIAIIACVGSRDPEHGYPYCSRICCMYSAKMAMLYKHAVHDGRAYIFYMDIRSAGKGYEEFIQRAVEEDGVVYLRSRVSRIFREGKRLIVWGADTLTGKRIELAVDLVVLATALRPSAGGEELLGRIDVERDASGFLREVHPKLRPMETSVPGIFVAGTAQAPRDIPDSVGQASGAASKVLSLFAQEEVETTPP
jgi:heterodisulfide reductase subunit A